MFSITVRQWMILFMVQLITLLYGMSITLANVVLPQVQGAMSATQDQIAWVVTFNLVATAVGIPLTGWLAYRVGWRYLLFFAMLGFSVFSLLCALAGSLETLVLYRFGQGFFGAPIMPMGQAILLATFPRHLHPMVTMMWGVGAVFGPVSGPVLGSYISEVYNWRGAFFMVVPPGVLATAFVWFALSGHSHREARSFDWTGFLALAIAIAAAQLVMDRGQRLDWLESPEIVIELIVAIIAFWIFVAHILTAKRPFIDPRMLLDRNFSLGLFIAFIMGMLSFTPMVLFPGLLNELRGYPESLIGLLLAGRGVGNWLSFLIVVQASRYFPRTALAIGLFSQAVAGWAMAQFDINLTSFDVFWTNLLQGFGFGLAFTPMSILTFATLAPRQVTEGMTLFHLVRNFGSSLFIAASVVLLVRSTAASYAVLLEGLSDYNKALSYPEVIGQWTLGTPSGLMALSVEVQRQAAMIGYINAFYLFALTALLATPLAFLMRPVPRFEEVR
ncbi:MAG: DHA2 family efflux MFS transporter permease subunit [Hyphomicrobiaceae bacterium]